MARRRFFADALANGAARVEGDAAAHLGRVLRVQPGQEYELAWEGRVYLGRVERVCARAVEFALLVMLADAQAEVAVELGVALFKFERWEWMLEKATELGATRIWPLTSRRTDPHLGVAADTRSRRWRQIGRQAAEQSRRARGPQVAAVQPFAAFLAQPFEGARILLSEEGGAAQFDGVPPLRLLIGPEGGWAPEELAAAAAAGFRAASLGPRILRCETAALAALVLAGRNGL